MLLSIWPLGTAKEVGYRVVGRVAIRSCRVISQDYRVTVGLELCAVAGSELGESWPKE